MYHRALQVRKEQPLLEEMLKLQKESRIQREKDRENDSSKRKKYTKMFEPLTESIQKLKPEPQPVAPTNPTPS